MTDRTATTSSFSRDAQRSASPRHPRFVALRFASRLNGGAFTLVELMISIALVVLLILGINSVFKYTAQAVGQGQAINTAVRDSRAAQTTMSNDFAALVPNGSGATDSASLIIASSATPAFMNAADKAGDIDGNPLTNDLNGDGIEGNSNGEKISPATYNSRNHRTDTLSFFARNSFHRQTGNDGTYVDDMTTQEAWVWYGHLWLPGNDQSSQANAFPPNGAAASSATYPGVGSVATNPNNVYASQFTIGRVAQLLKLASAGAIADPNGVPQNFTTYPAATSSVMAPLAFDGKGTDSNSTPIFQSRFDLTATSIKRIQNQVAAALALTPANNNWWCPTVYATSSYSGAGAGTPPYTTPLLRFQANPTLSKPLTAAKIAAAAPYFIPGCSQFIVEYAGDFVTQDNDPSHINNGVSPALHPAIGQITAYGGDGTLDYVMVQGATGVPLNRSTWTKQIMWYGMPRNTSGYSTTNWANGDTAPISDFLFANAVDSSGNAISTLANSAAFEKSRPAYNVDYTSTGGMSANDSQKGYICAFGPNDPAPSLIRITMTLNDAGGQLPDGQTYQFVFAVPPQ